MSDKEQPVLGAVKVGDLIEIRRIKCFEGDEWIPAEIISTQLNRNCISARFLRVQYGNDGKPYEYQALEAHDEKRTWRRT